MRRAPRVRWTTPNPSGLRRRTDRRASTEEDVVTSTADDAEVQRSLVAKLGMAAGTVVQEIGYDDDCDAV